MRNADFHQPILLIAKEGEKQINSPSDAYELLMRDWPQSRGKWYHAATRACRSASSGETSPHIARRMFMYAATEARLAAR